MKMINVKDLMVPLEEYATVSEDATLFEALIALEKAQQALDRTRYKYLHRAVLVYDHNKKIVGKMSQFDALRALEPKYVDMGDVRSISRAGFSPDFLKEMLENQALLSANPQDICREAADRLVKDYMNVPSQGEFVDENASMREAVHLLVMGHHQSLLVTREKDIVGILRLTDVLMSMFQLMKTLKNGPETPEEKESPLR